MLKRLLATLVVFALGVGSSAVAHAQVDKILGQVVSWILQKQIDELEKANDPNRPLSEYDGGSKFDARDQYAPRDQPRYQDTSAYRNSDKEDASKGYDGSKAFEPTPR